MIRRMESRAMGLVFEWDEESENVALAQLVATGQVARDQAYDRLIELHKVLGQVVGVEWLDTELTERRKAVCGVSALALVWRAQMRTQGGARACAEAVAYGLGMTAKEFNDGRE